MSARLFPAKAVRHRRHGQPCNSCTSALRFTPDGRAFEIRAGHGQPPQPAAARGKTIERYLGRFWTRAGARYAAETVLEPDASTPPPVVDRIATPAPKAAC